MENKTKKVPNFKTKLRTHTCGILTTENKGETVTLTGWVNSRRDHGGVIFIDLRDHYGITQIKVNPDDEGTTEIGTDFPYLTAEGVRSEYVLQVTGSVEVRPADMVNEKLITKETETGKIEVEAKTIKILNESLTPPFEIDKEQKVEEDIRLKYRYLDLRRAKLQEYVKLRHEVIKYIRNYLDKQGFIDVQTPIMANSSPEGARDFIVPSRLHPGKFYALPQAPQQFKQLLMIAGIDKYYQIAPCFRDEDPRADRAPCEFYQLDLEMAFVGQEDVFQSQEPLWIELTEKVVGKKVLKKPLPRIPYREAMLKYGSDKPDLRFDLEIQDVSDVFTDSKFQVFKSVLDNKGVVRCLKAEGAGKKFSRKHIDELTQIAQDNGAKGLAYIIYEGGELKSPILKFFSEEEIAKLAEKIDAKDGDIVFFGADEEKVVCQALGAVRSELGKRLELTDPNVVAWAWITNFPMYQYDDKAGKIDFMHNPFSMPQVGKGHQDVLETLAKDDPLDILAYQYDIVGNGYELCSGAVRNHRPDIMYKAFEIAGYSQEEVDKNFGHMIKAFKYGAPPHGGYAPGIDRILMVLTGNENIREIIAFPKNGSAYDPMLDTPAEVSEKQLKEVHVKLDRKK
ncbi:MAG: aspartate--tRNA ligase [Parcubacteria group bacterium]|nr:aspartate--tRNA ligase [Parcubacteria group bacterium]